MRLLIFLKFPYLVYTERNSEKMHFRNEIRKDYRGADKSLNLPGREQATATEDFDFHISYL